jgi:xylan 1,4-beta-xylosidase
MGNASLRDFHNYLVTAERIDGDWSDPIYLNSSGFDPSLFHDEDGRKYVLNMLWDHRPNTTGSPASSSRSIRRRANADRRAATDLPRHVDRFSRRGRTVQARRVYHLIVAEGGTFWGHAVTMARSREIAGPYELHPDTHVLTARHRPDSPLQRAGTAPWWRHRTVRPTWPTCAAGPCPAADAASLVAKLRFRRWLVADDWLRTADGEGSPHLSTPAPKLPPTRSPRRRYARNSIHTASAHRLPVAAHALP